MPNQVSSLRRLLWMSSCALIQIVAQFLFQAVLAARFGSNASVDALSIGLTLPTVISAILVGSVGYVLIPLLAPHISCPEPDVFWKFTSGIGAMIVAASLLFSILLFGFAANIQHWFFPNLTERTSIEAVTQIRWLSSLVLFSGILGWLQATYHAQQRFYLPALASAIGPAITTAGVLFLPSVDITQVSIMLILGSLVAVLIQLVPILGHLTSPFASQIPYRQFIMTLLPLVLLSAYTKLDPLIDRVFASSLGEGSIAHLNYAQRFVTALIMLTSSALSTLAFPELSQVASLESRNRFQVSFQRSWNRMLLAGLPITAGGILFSHLAVRDLLQRGAFTPGDTQVVAELFSILLGFFVAASFGDLLAKSFYALGDTRTPAIIGAIAFTVGVVLRFSLTREYGVQGLAWSNSLYYLLSAASMFLLLVWRLRLSITKLLFSESSLKITLATMVSIAVTYAVTRSSFGNTVWVALPIAVVTYLATLLSAKETTVMQMLGRSDSSSESGHLTNSPSTPKGESA